MDVYFSNIKVVYKSHLKTSSRFWKKNQEIGEKMLVTVSKKMLDHVVTLVEPMDGKSPGKITYVTRNECKNGRNYIIT